jgi:hypothetical protein
MSQFSTYDRPKMNRTTDNIYEALAYAAAAVSERRLPVAENH